MSIVVATDLSTRSAAALRFAEELARKLEVVLTVVHVAPDTRSDIADDAENALEMFLREYLDDPGAYETHVIVGDTIGKLAEAARGYELLVCGATGSSYLDDIFLGSTASRLIRESPCPVCVVPDNHVPHFGAVAVPVGFDEASRVGLDLAGLIARSTGASLCLIHSLDPHGGGTAKEARDRLERLAEDADVGDLSLAFEVTEGDPAEGIRETVAQRDIDIVVMGTHGRGDQALYFLGSVAERIVRQPPCAVITTRPR